VISRINHKYGKYSRLYLEKLRHKSQNASFGVVDLIGAWKSDWFSHQKAVRQYFADSPRFLEFDIEKDPVNKLVTFLEGHSIKITSKTLPHSSNRRKMQSGNRRSWRVFFRRLWRQLIEGGTRRKRMVSG
jgi:hypothetical protein